METIIAEGPETITVHVPLTLRKRGARKQIVTPQGTSWAAPRARIDTAMVKALARGFRWRKMLETGVYATANEIAVAEKINRSYISRLLRLTLLAPDIVEAVLDGRAPTIIAQEITLQSLPDVWEAQRRMVAYEQDSDSAHSKGRRRVAETGPVAERPVSLKISRNLTLPKPWPASADLSVKNKELVRLAGR